jgi:superkiller protein 3
MKMTAKYWAISLTVVGALGCGGCQKASHEQAVFHYVNAMSLEAAALNQDAIQELTEAVRLNHDFSLAYSMLGKLYRQEGKLEEAAGAYENACRIDPWAFDDHLGLGQVYQALKRFGDAVVALRRACELRPDHAAANYALGTCYYAQGQYAEAATFCGRAAELSPGNDEILASLGDIYNKQGDDYRAIDAYKQALELNPIDADVMVRLGMLYVDMKRFEPGQLVLEKAVAAAPDQIDPHLGLAYCLLMQQQLPAALAQYQAALQVAPGNHKVHRGLGVTHILMYLNNQQDKQLCQNALDSWHRSLELNPDQPQLRKWIEQYGQALHATTQTAGMIQ